MKIFEKELENWIVNIGVAGKLPPKKNSIYNPALIEVLYPFVHERLKIW